TRAGPHGQCPAWHRGRASPRGDDRAPGSAGPALSRVHSMPDAVDLRPLPGPIPSLMPSGYDLADVGYVEEEYLLEGVAESDRLAGGRTPGGRWTAETDGRSPYRTRLLVRRPVDPDRFSGTVLVE